MHAHQRPHCTPARTRTHEDGASSATAPERRGGCMAPSFSEAPARTRTHEDGASSATAPERRGGCMAPSFSGTRTNAHTARQHACAHTKTERAPPPRPRGAAGAWHHLSPARAPTPTLHASTHARTRRRSELRHRAREARRVHGTIFL